MGIEGDIHRAFGKPRRLDPGDVGPFRRVRNLRGQVGPRRAAVTSQVDLPVVGAGIDEPGLEPRFRDVEQRSVLIDAVVLGDLHVLELGAHQHEGIPVDRRSQVAADDLPRLAPIGRAKQLVAPDVNRGRIVGRNDERGIPIPPVRLLGRRGLGPNPLLLTRHLVHPGEISFL